MRINRWMTRVVLVTTLAVGGGAAMAACGTTTPEAMCSYVIGDGQSGHDTKIHKVVLPGDDIGNLDKEVARFVPCNSRNYIINDGSVQVNQGAGQPPSQVGDRFTPSRAFTKDGTPVLVWSNSYWTLNESDAALRAFYNVCYKYTCFSNDNKAGAANFSTPGWNGLLGENFGPTIDEIASAATATIPDAIWQKQDATLRDQLGAKMSALFKAAMQKKFGFPDDLFCGSGNSGWNPDHSAYNCSDVRIEVPRVDRDTPTAAQAASNPAAQQQLNADALAAAKAKYGPDAGYWLGVEDTVNACKGSTVPCTVYVGNPPSTPAH